MPHAKAFDANTLTKKTLSVANDSFGRIDATLLIDLGRIDASEVGNGSMALDDFMNAEMNGTLPS